MYKHNNQATIFVKQHCCHLSTIYINRACAEILFSFDNMQKSTHKKKHNIYICFSQHMKYDLFLFGRINLSSSSS